MSLAKIRKTRFDLQSLSCPLVPDHWCFYLLCGMIVAMMIYEKEALDVLQTKLIIISVDALLRAIKVSSPMKLADLVF